MTWPPWFVTAVGLVMLVVLALGIWIVLRWFRPGDQKRPSGVLAGVAAFLVASVAAVVLILAWTIYRGWFPNPSTTRQTLRSGHQVDVVWQGVRRNGEPTWVMEYRTWISMKERRYMLPIWREATELSKELPEEAERSGVASVWLQPVSFDHEIRFDGFRPVVLSRMSTTFMFSKKSDGTWEQSGGWREH